MNNMTEFHSNMISTELLQLKRITPTDTVGIMLSGGMDSALLLYLLAKYIDNTIIPFTVPKTDGAKYYVTPIVDWINNTLDKRIQQPILIGDPLIHHSQIINFALKMIEGQYDVLYFAGNTYPEDVLPNGPKRTRRKQINHIQPFFDCYKTDIVQAYVDYGILDLITLTHTCTEKEFGRCNICWQCRERQWAFNELQLTDIGTL